MAAYLLPLDQGKKIALEKAIVFIGRHPECDVVLSQSKKISRKHCCLAQINDAVVIRDLGSTNGVHVNGKRVTREARLSANDQVTIGDCRYVFKTATGGKEVKASAAVPQTTKKGPSNGTHRTPKPIPATVSNDDLEVIDELEIVDDDIAEDLEVELDEDLDELDVIGFDDDRSASRGKDSKFRDSGYEMEAVGD